MATLTTNVSFSERKQGFIARFAARISRGIEAHGRVASRRDLIEALEAKSDAELSAMGLHRDEIPYYVFRDLYYIGSSFSGARTSVA